MADKRIELAAALAAAGLGDKAQELLREAVNDATGFTKLKRSVQELEAKLETSGLVRPRKRKRSTLPPIEDRLTNLLGKHGIMGVHGIVINRGHWTHDHQDVMRWECHARIWNGVERPESSDFHVGSWSNAADCLRYGITVVDGTRDGDYCDISISSINQRSKRKR